MHLEEINEEIYYFEANLFLIRAREIQTIGPSCETDSDENKKEWT